MTSDLTSIAILLRKLKKWVELLGKPQSIDMACMCAHNVGITNNDHKSMGKWEFPKHMRCVSINKKRKTRWPSS